MTSKKYVSFTEYVNLLKQFKPQSSNYEGIVIPLRGGFYVGDPIARSLQIPYFIYDVRCYQNGTKLLKPAWFKGEKLDKGHYLICDDIYDTGCTIELIKDWNKNCSFDIFTLISKKENIANHQFIQYVEPNVWVDFYWESYFQDYIKND